MSSENTKKADQTGVQDEQHPAMGMMAYVAGGVIGLVVLVGLAAVLKGEGPTSRTVEELPHLAILVSFEDFNDAATRLALAELQRDLVGTGLAVAGPLNYPILVPGESLGDEPTARDLDVITADELGKAMPFMASSKWLVPRVYSGDMREAVLRVAPPGRGHFPSGSATKVRQVLEKHKGAFNEVMAYSRALGLEDDAARDRINLTFGVQSANVLVVAEQDGFLEQPTIVAQIKGGADALKSPLVRSKVTTGSFVEYYMAVMTQNTAINLANAPTKAILAQAAEWNVPVLLSGDGKQAWVEVYTEAEGKDNADLCYYVAANLKRVEGARYRALRKRKLSVE
jgi:hypothetical protein